MRVFFGVVSLLVVLAIVGITLTRHTKVDVPTGAAANVGTVREQAAQFQEKVVNDVASTMDMAASARAAEAGK
jgi:competence protein ComGC